MSRARRAQALAGDVCTVSTGGGKYGPEGSRGRVKMVNGVLTCVADHMRAGGSSDPRDAAITARDHQRVMSELYARLDAETSQAWRGK
jgi:hypothetical protein